MASTDRSGGVTDHPPTATCDPATAGDRRPRVLLLGGTAEARQLATGLCTVSTIEVISSLAGSLTTSHLPPGPVRIGGFGGAGGLADWLRTERISAVVDATHPFAATMTAAAATACARVGLPLLVLRRPGWQRQPGDDWHRVPSLRAAAWLLPDLGERVMLTVGRRGVRAFAQISACWFLARSVEPPEPPTPQRMEVLLARGPFTLDGERALLARHRIDVLITKDSGGAMARAKLVAAGEAGLPVVLVDRPPPPPGVPIVTTVDAARTWLLREWDGQHTGRGS